MDLIQLTRIAFRRWFVFFPLLVIVVVAALSASSSTSTNYVARGSVLVAERFTIPAPPEATAISNPVAASGMSTTAAALAISAGSGDSRRTIREQGLDGSYSVSQQVTRNVQPLLIVEVTTHDSTSASATLKAVLDLLDSKLAAQQAGLPDTVRSTVVAERLEGDGSVSSNTSDARRVLIVFLGLGIVLTLIITVVVDNVMLALRRRRNLPGARRQLSAVGRDGAPLARSGT